MALILVHIGTTTTAVCTRNHSLFQLILFLVLRKCIWTVWLASIVMTLTDRSPFIQIRRNLMFFFSFAMSACPSNRLNRIDRFSIVGVLFGDHKWTGCQELEILFAWTVLRQQWPIHINRILNTNSIELHAYDCRCLTNSEYVSMQTISVIHIFLFSF